MNSYLKSYLRCPICLSVLNKAKSILYCSKRHQFKVEQGIPILLDYQNLPIHSQNQQIYFEKNIKSKTIDSSANLDYWKVKYLQRFKENFKNVKDKLICEVGTGGGYMAIGLAKIGAKVVACDITVKNLIALKRLAKKLKLEDNLSFVCCSAHQLPFKNSFCDYFVLNSVLEHIPEEEKTIREIERTLKKAGGVMMTVPIKYKYIHPLLLPLNYFHDKRIGHLRRYDDISLRNKLQSFYLKKMYFTGHPIKVLKVIINMIVRIFDEKEIEEEDQKKDNIKLWSSNLIAFLHKK